MPFTYKVKFVARAVAFGPFVIPNTLEVQTEIEVKKWKMRLAKFGDLEFTLEPLAGAFGRFRASTRQVRPNDVPAGRFFCNGDLRIHAGVEGKTKLRLEDPLLQIGNTFVDATGKATFVRGILDGETRIGLSIEGSTGWEIEVAGRKRGQKWPFGGAWNIVP